MGRRSSGGGRSYSTGSSWPKFRSSSKKSSPKPTKDKDEKAPPSAKVETTHGGSRSFGPSIVDGFSFGTGNAMGHRFVEAIFGPRTIRQEVVVAENAKEVATVSATDDNEKLKDYSESCSSSYDTFQECLNVEGNNLRKCYFFMDMLFECRKNSSSCNF